MKTSEQDPYSGTYRLGLALIAVSFLIYLLGVRTGEDFAVFSGTFGISYVLALGYPVILLVQKLRLPGRPRISHGCWINVVILFTISAFSLNREMYVFARFPAWLNVYTLASVPLFLIFPYYSKLPAFLKALVLFLSGASLVLSVYMFVYLMPLIPLSCIALVALGISVHTFVPAMWLCVLGDFLIRRAETGRNRWLLFAGGLVPLLILSWYLNQWRNLQLDIRNLIAEHNILTDNQLPPAIYLAQKLQSDALADEILVSDFKSQRFWGDGFSFANDGRWKYHNPLAIIADGLFGSLHLDEKTVSQILNIRQNYRHSTTEKLWTGISLSTSAISTNIRLYPQYRMAYHEKNFVIHNQPGNTDGTWFRTETQEALYTFHLPEGSIVTSLSLWINGREEKSRLTTRQKADSAYKEIVGVQRRDPALVHWKEGNAVTVNIFPCTPSEDRRFKIGFTTPLGVSGDALVMDNIWFEGPDFREAREVTRILPSGGNLLEAPAGFVKDADGGYSYRGTYLPHWRARIRKQPLSADSFSFGGYRYSVAEAHEETAKAQYSEVYLDLTKSWTRAEYDHLLGELGSFSLYAWLPAKTRITAENKDLVWQQAGGDHFSVPFLHDIDDPEHAVVITKSTLQSPLLSDMENSETADRLKSSLASREKKISVLSIGDELSPFWRSLRELRLLNFEETTAKDAAGRVRNGITKIFREDSTRVTIAQSRLEIRRSPADSTTANGQAPDHLLRVFAYNDLLGRIGNRFFDREKYADVLFREAEEAYVLSPVTSMIVLESEADYERMGIGANSKTVGNASLSGGGAVPEPHEWALIALVGLFILRHLYLVRARRVAT